MSESHGATLPHGWCQVEIDEVAEIVTGNTPPKNDPDNYGSSYPWVRPPDLGSDAAILETSQRLSEKGARVARLLPPGAALVSCIGTLGRVGIAGTTLATNQQINSLVFQDMVEARYGFYYCQTLKDWLADNSSATTIAIVNKSRFSKAPFLLAPKAEQLRIVAEIEKQFTRLDSAVAALKRVQASLKSYRAAVLKAACEGRLVPTEAELARKEGRSYETGEQLLARILKDRRAKWEADQLARIEASGKPPKNDDWKKKYREPSAPDYRNLPSLPGGWSWASLEQLTSAARPICYGILMPKDNVQDGVLYVKVKDMKGDKVDVASLHRTTREIAAAYERASLRAGDLLLAIRGTYGRVAKVPPELDGGNITQDTVRLDVNRGVDSAYLAASLRAPVVQMYFKHVARGVAVKGVNVADVRLTPIALPPTVEQRQIAEAVDVQSSTLDEVKSEIDSERLRADRLRQSILKRAFEGKLVPQDPNDEPASVLLERIRADRAAKSPQSNMKVAKQRRPKMPSLTFEPEPV